MNHEVTQDHDSSDRTDFFQVQLLRASYTQTIFSTHTRSFLIPAADLIVYQLRLCFRSCNVIVISMNTKFAI
jgi:hypothetical protein